MKKTQPPSSSLSVPKQGSIFWKNKKQTLKRPPLLFSGSKVNFKKQEEN